MYGNQTKQKPFLFRIIDSALWRAHDDSKSSSKSDEKTGAMLYFIEYGEKLIKDNGKEKLISPPL